MTALPYRRPQRRWRSKSVLATVVVALVLGALVADSRGERRATIRDTLRRFNRRWFNPLMLRFAGRVPWPLARLEHRGRRSGAFRATPVLSWPISGGFVVPMPYGTEVDWARNLRHAGEGVLQYQGLRYRIGNPRAIPVRDALGDLPFPVGLLIGLSGIRHVARVEVLPSLTPEVSLPV